MIRIIKTTIIGPGMKSFALKIGDINPNLSLDQRIALHRKIADYPTNKKVRRKGSDD